MQTRKTIFERVTISSCLLVLSACTTTPCYSGFPVPPESLMQNPRELKPVLENNIQRPVTLQEFVLQVNENYETCHLNAEDFRALQEWVRKQQEK